MSAGGIRNQGSSAGAAQAVILYDRLETMLAANQFLGRLPRPSGGDGDWTVNSWRFDMLRRGNEGQAALRETAETELMVLAVGNEPDRWDWPEDWLARWAAGRKVPKARLALVLVRAADGLESAPGLIGPLRRLAERAGLRLLVLAESGSDSDGRQRSPQPFAQSPKQSAEPGSALDLLCAAGPRT